MFAKVMPLVDKRHAREEWLAHSHTKAPTLSVVTPLVNRFYTLCPFESNFESDAGGLYQWMISRTHSLWPMELTFEGTTRTIYILVYGEHWRDSRQVSLTSGILMASVQDFIEELHAALVRSNSPFDWESRFIAAFKGEEPAIGDAFAWWSMDDSMAWTLAPRLRQRLKTAFCQHRTRIRVPS